MAIYTNDYSKNNIEQYGKFDNSGTPDTIEDFLKLINESVVGGQTFTNGIVSTYSLVYTTSGAYEGGVLSSNGDIHFVPFNAYVGQKINTNTNVISTYSLAYTTGNAYNGGILAPNGDIHFVPYNATVGQKISPNGIVSTYSLAYTTGKAYNGGVVSPNGDIHFVPGMGKRGQKINSNGVVSTYSLLHTVSSSMYCGGVVSPNGDIHFVPWFAMYGQKININGVVSTYAMAFTTTDTKTFNNGVFLNCGTITPNGEIYFIPVGDGFGASVVGQKISKDGVVSTYNIICTGNQTPLYMGSVLAPNGDIHLIPHSSFIGQKISKDGVVSTYSLAYTIDFSYWGGILAQNGDIHFIPYNARVGQKISTLPAVPYSNNLCCSPYFNKL